MNMVKMVIKFSRELPNNSDASIVEKWFNEAVEKVVNNVPNDAVVVKLADEPSTSAVVFADDVVINIKTAMVPVIPAYMIYKMNGEIIIVGTINKVSDVAQRILQILQECKKQYCVSDVDVQVYMIYDNA